LETVSNMRTEQEPTSSAPESRDRRIAAEAAEWSLGDAERRGMERALTDALADILRHEAKEATRAARH